MNIEHGHSDEHRDGHQLDSDGDGVDARALFDAGNQEEHQQENNHNSGHIADAAAALGKRTLGEFGRQAKSDSRQRIVKVTRPSVGDGRNRDAIFKDQIPGDDPGDQLAERSVAVAVSAAAAADAGREFCVSQRRKRAGNARDDERQHHSGTRLGGGGMSCQYENAGADNGADAQQGQVERRQALLEAMIGVVIRHWLFAKERVHGVRVPPSLNGWPGRASSLRKSRPSMGGPWNRSFIASNGSWPEWVHVPS